MRCSSNDFDWNTDTIARLRSLWAEGLSTAEIGRRMGVSKNAVIGKSHRLDLPARPSPIRRDGARKPPAPRRLPCPNLTELQNRPVSASTPLPVRTVPGDIHPDPAEAAPPTQIVRETMPVSTAILGTQPCCWPIGELGTRGFRFCEVPNEAGKPYCPEHCRIAYRRKEPRQKAA
jgi:GcrA cell cycle regulator